MNDAHLLATFRRDRAARWASTCTITRGDGEKVWNPDTGDYDEGTTAVYTGRCGLSSPGRTASDVQAAGAAYAVSDYLVTVPIGTDVHVDDTVTVSDSLDPAVDGLVLIVEKVPKSDVQVVRDVWCREYLQEPT